MQTQNQTKLFAFKLAEKKEGQAASSPQWQIRDGVSVAGCTLAEGDYDFRYSEWGSTDNSIYC